MNAAFSDLKHHRFRAGYFTNEAHSYNDFDCPDRVSITEHTAVIKDNVLKLNIPPCAVVECVVD